MKGCPKPQPGVTVDFSFVWKHFFTVSDNPEAAVLRIKMLKSINLCIWCLKTEKDWECQMAFLLQQLVPVRNSYQTPEYPIIADIQYNSTGGFRHYLEGSNHFSLTLWLWALWALWELLCRVELQGSQRSWVNWESRLTAATGRRLPEIQVHGLNSRWKSLIETKWKREGCRCCT